jgi:tetratricopeptide (TPR) repeat protein
MPPPPTSLSEPVIDPRRVARLASRLAFLTALLMASALWCQSFYRHFANSKSLALWILVSFGIVGAVAARRTGPLAPQRWDVMRLFRAALLISPLIWGVSLLGAADVGHGLEEYTRIVPIFAVGWWCSQRPLSWRRDTPRALGVMFLTTAVVLVLGVLQWQVFQRTQLSPATVQMLNRWGLLSHDRMLSTLGNANSGAAFYSSAFAIMMGCLCWDRVAWRPFAAIALTLLTAVVLSRNSDFFTPLILIAYPMAIIGTGLVAKDRSLWWRLLACGLGAGMLYALLATDSRSGRVSTAAGLVAALVVWLGTRRDLDRPVRWAANLGFAVTVVVFVVGLAWLRAASISEVRGFNTWLSDRWQSFMHAIHIDAGKSSFLDRLYIWKGASEMVHDYPVLGVGWGQFPVIYPKYTLPEYYALWPVNQLITTEEAHSGHLNIATETGLPGAAAWLALFVIAWVAAMQRMRWAAEGPATELRDDEPSRATFAWFAAARGDESSRATLIWFAPAVALATHMGIDKFLAYPASLTLLLWSLGQMVRPRTVPAVAPPPRRRVLTVGLIGLAVATVAAIPSLQLGAGSNALARGRLQAEQASDIVEYIESVSRSSNQSQMYQLSVRARTLIQTANRSLADARRHAPWEIDSWTRSLDFLTVQNRFESPGSEAERWLRTAIMVSPNYYPVQRNMGMLLVARWKQQLAAGREPDPELLDLAQRLYQQTFALRPGDLSTLFQMAELLSARGEKASAETYYAEFLATPNIDNTGLGMADEARSDLARLLAERGENERALELLDAAMVRAFGLDPMSLWVRAALCEVNLGRFGAAWRHLAERVRAVSTTEIERRISLLQQRPREPGDVALMMVCLLALGQGREAVALVTPPADMESQVTDWLFAAVVARIASEDLARGLLASAEARFPGNPLVASAESELLGP